MAKQETEFKDSITRDHLSSMMGGGMKSITTLDLAGRSSIVYEAPLNAELGDGCLITVYKFVDGDAGSSRQIIAYEETVGVWPGYTSIGGTDAEDINTVP